MAATKAVRRRTERRRADLAEARVIGEEYGLGAIDEVIRQCRDRSGLIHVADFLFTGAIVWGIGGVFFVVLPSGPESFKVEFGLFIAGTIMLASVLMALGELFKAVGCRHAVYSGGIAQLSRKEPAPRVLRWADVETVTITAKKDDEGDPKTEVESCLLTGAGTEITAGPGSDIFVTAPGREVAAAAHRNLAPRLVPPLIEECQSGAAITAGWLSVQQEGITLRRGSRCAWSEITSMAVTYDGAPPSAPITRIGVRTAGTSYDQQLNLSGIPNGMFLADAIAHTAAGHGVEVKGYRRP
jgi:hypothetical protein